MKVALFKRLDDNCEPSVLSWSSWCTADDYTLPGYVRVSEWVDVEFPPLKNEQVIRGALAEIDRAEQQARDKFQAVLEQFKNMRASLLALPAPVEA